ncbi:Sarcosine oxidase, gamma subunit family [Sulfitobacter noctilucicola]|uniref:Sarcosine oxidase subunit gamma n=1 Tax=Sulfitobacter noctilucicola TaxID=1342301 RepID=A0A7W6MAF4_9RHOB|nr:sarcosine oxidase subunit gamma family protein [Sulfitobacter noctilucicola]KIN64114.1 Sarcosine oxidase, gamma subunit family [Sulfitobacter noctilucicola]MBB4175468.1 sarcosine oxidase subunit gamma [Sulfitobacter noctilucicola]
MSDPVTALKGAKNTDGFASVTEIGPLGMITLRGDLSAKPLIKAAVAASGVTMPEQGHCATEGEQGMAWMSPDELLIMCPYAEVGDRLSELQGKLAKHHALAVNVSDARAVFRLRSTQVRDVIAKLAPVDMHPDVFTSGTFRRTRFAQIPAAFWLPEPDVAQIICFRSVARYMYDLLNIAAQEGSEVNHFSR